MKTAQKSNDDPSKSIARADRPLQLADGSGDFTDPGQTCRRPTDQKA